MSKSHIHYKRYICAFVFLILAIWVATLIMMNQALAKAIGARCSDFSNRRDLQQFVAQHPEMLPKLDRDHDGIPCESLQ